MVKSIPWPLEVQKFVLSWVDEHKSTESPLIQNPKDGLVQLKESLEENFKATKPAFVKALTPTQVEQKLRSFWADRLENLKLKASDIQVFYEQGLSTLDWTKLGRKPIGKAYSADQIETFKQPSLETEEREDNRQLNKNGKRPSSTRQPDIEASSDEDPVRPFQRKKVINPEVEPETDSLSELGTIDQELSNEQESRNARPIRSHHSRYSLPKLLLIMLATGVLKANCERVCHYSSEELGSATGAAGAPRISATAARLLKANERAKGDDSQSAALPNSSKQLTIPPPVHLEEREDEEGATSPVFTWNSGLERAKYGIVPTAIADVSIRETMEDIATKIQNVVVSYMSSLKISPQQPAFLDGDLRYPPQCLSLLGQVLGDIGAYGTERRAEQLLTFHQTRTGLGRLLESVICCAVTQWCFHADLDEDAHYSEIGGGDLRNTFNKAFDATLQAEIRRRLWIEHISTHIIPKIDSDACKKAALLQTYIDLLIPADSPDEDYERDAVISLPGLDPRRTNTTTSPTAEVPSPFRPEETLHRAQFRNGFADVYKRALRWRIDLSMRLQESYMFLWPSFLALYVPDTHRREGSRDSEDENSPGGRQVQQRRVRLGMKPIVWRCTKRKIGDNWSDWELVCRGEVIPL
ncbi:hypothetical protein H2200_007650 [Cladophialophora chaetospira]|uniref:Uncharacterized protein n=1 Tax=Cladophialophora chaetospira TaxID=386627 RepID=A0AA39CGN7_9EURO|nr:hypothetical protein H2200_007650 [Cladophialophora chaetospira]